MVDLILVIALGVSFYAGFKTGNSFKTLGDLLQAGLDALKKK